MYRNEFLSLHKSLHNLLCSIVLLVLGTLVCFTSQAQNLIPNPSFEEIDSCPPSIGHIELASPWVPMRDTPDLFHECAAGTTAGIPYTEIFGYQQVEFGSAYTGLFLFDSGSEYREYFGVQLNESLESGDSLYFSFYVSRADGGDMNQIFNCACNNLGFRLTNEVYSLDNPAPLDDFSHWHCTQIMDDTISWVLMSGSLLIMEHYEYVVFGNFYSNQLTDTLDYVLGDCKSYYYLDNICFSKSPICDVVNLSDYPSYFAPLIYPSVFDDKLWIQMPNGTNAPITIYNLSGECVFHSFETGSTTLDTHLFSNGIYIVNISNLGNIYSAKIIKY